ncbi:hypothetical protein LJ737_13645 [Hymenobacter sp. 15J16-1T3B]|uniref:hypothetical protein n=1 Tax=Hymenobacter sp. 15J16-1T3B TaxID=2886941 RepID=UPI001D11A63F|nr:hypothetical protein [Hymenobacter sp. 15J16-1T3B]MCC3158287.1 hypothetical protein [Hymenobacter sp. 15J16-1T3B]
MLRVLGSFAAVCALILLLARSCESDSKPAVISSQGHIIGNIAWRDTLFLSASFSECGEWGGHRELIKVYLRADKLPKAGPEWIKWRKGPLTAAFWLDTIGCSKPIRKFFPVSQHLISLGEEESITRYLQQLQTHSLQEVYPSQTGSVYQAWLTNDELRLHFLDTREGWTGFGELREKLFKQNKRP